MKFASDLFLSQGKERKPSQYFKGFVSKYWYSFNVFGISGFEFILIAVIAFVVIGPERMPGYAQNLKEFIKYARGMALGAKEDLKDTLGENPLGDFDWKQYDPRQYDPRVIVREALAEDDAERAAADEARRQAEAEKFSANKNRLPRGAYAPFDVDAT